MKSGKHNSASLSSLSVVWTVLAGTHRMDGVHFLHSVTVLYEGMSSNAAVADESAKGISIIENKVKNKNHC